MKRSLDADTKARGAVSLVDEIMHTLPDDEQEYYRKMVMIGIIARYTSMWVKLRHPEHHAAITNAGDARSQTAHARQMIEEILSSIDAQDAVRHGNTAN